VVFAPATGRVFWFDITFSGSLGKGKAMRIDRTKLTWLSGFLTCALPVAGAVSAALPYRGRNGEPYSIWSHFVSELGEIGVSGNAQIFNFSLIAAGLALAAFALGLGLLLRSQYSYVAAAFGVHAALSCGIVGVVPLNSWHGHNLAAGCCFNSSLAAITLFSLAILKEPPGVLPHWVVIPCVVTMVSLATLVALPSLLPVLQWLVVFCMLAWVALTTGALWLRKPAASQAIAMNGAERRNRNTSQTISYKARAPAPCRGSGSWAIAIAAPITLQISGDSRA
jgi:hypothetical protein